MASFYYNRLLKEQFISVAESVKEKYDDITAGNYSIEDGKLQKGDITISDDTQYIDEIKEESGLYVTIFYGDERALTNIKDKTGKRITGTKAAVDEELQSGIVSSVISSLVIIMLFIIVMYFLIKNIVSAITNTKIQIDEVSKGNIVEKSLVKFENRNDEIGDILRASKNLVSSLRSTVLSILNASSQLKSFADEYNKSFEMAEESIKNVNSAVNEIANSATVQAQESQSASERIIDLGNVIDTTTNSVRALFNSSKKMKD